MHKFYPQLAALQHVRMITIDADNYKICRR